MKYNFFEIALVIALKYMNAENIRIKIVGEDILSLRSEENCSFGAALYNGQSIQMDNIVQLMKLTLSELTELKNNITPEGFGAYIQ